MYTKIILLILVVILLVSPLVAAGEVWIPVSEFQGIQIGDNIITAIQVFGNKFETSFINDYIFICYPDCEFIYNPRNSEIVEINIRIEN